MNNQAKRIDIISIKMVKEGSFLYPERAVSSPQGAVRLLLPFLEDCDREKTVVAYLNTKNEPVSVHVVSIGTINASLVSPAEVFKGGLLSNSTSILLAHNHPSGSVDPSREDREITKRLVEAGKIIGIQVIDHIILGSEGKFYSFKEQGEL